MQLKTVQLINIITQIFLMIGSAYIGYLFGKDKNFLMNIVIIYLIEAVCISILIQIIYKTRDKLEQEKENFSNQLFSLKVSENNNSNVTVFPDKDASFSTNEYSKIEITVNTPYVTSDTFDFSIKSNKKIDLTLESGTLIDPVEHTGNYNYFIKNNLAENLDYKYYKLTINIKPLLSKEHYNIEIIAEDSDIKGNQTFSFYS